MDGNGRWAARRGQPRVAGHRAGVEAVRSTVDTGARLGLGALTLYAFSTENWKRPRLEVDALMRMLKRYLRIELEEIHRQNIRFQPIGRIEGLRESVRRELERAVRRLWPVLQMRDYARFDFRLTPDNEAYFIEANANPGFSPASRSDNWKWPEYLAAMKTIIANARYRDAL
jgi:hypothetical protein